MLKTFASVAPFLKFNPAKVTIDNIVFQLHYRWTFLMLLVATILVTSRQYIGEHIKCISETIPEKVINTYCFFTPTFTVVRHLNNTELAKGNIFEPGIGPYEVSGEAIKHHAYYQWVPFVLFGQALCFYIPHLLWKSWEGGRLRSLVFGLRMVGLTQYLKDTSKVDNLAVPSLEDAEKRVRDIRRTMVASMRLNETWGARLILAETLNLINLIGQLFVTNSFLNGAFFILGIRIMNQNWTERMDFLDIVFPKVTKCHFFKFGASGSLQMHDTLCVMALNIINEKIYSVLWFWYFIVLIASVLGITMRIFTIFFHKRLWFARNALSWAKSGKLDDKELSAVIKKCNFSNFMFLYFLRCNMSDFLFKKVIYHLSSEFPNPQQDNARNLQLVQEQQYPSSAPTSSGMSTLKIDEVDKPLLNDKYKMK